MAVERFVGALFHRAHSEALRKRYSPIGSAAAARCCASNRTPLDIFAGPVGRERPSKTGFLSAEDANPFFRGAADQSLKPRRIFFASGPRHSLR